MKESNHTSVQFVPEFSRKCEMNSHIASVHESKLPHKCSIYKKEFTQKSKRNHHIASVHEKSGHTNAQDVKKNLPRKLMNKHNAAVHEGKQQYKCSTCEKQFSLKGTEGSCLMRLLGPGKIRISQKSH